MIDILIINSTNPKFDIKVYQHLYESKVTSIEMPAFAALIASYVRNKNFSVALADMQDSEKWNEKSIVDFIKNEKPYLVYVVVYGSNPSASTMQVPASSYISKYIKNEIPDCKIMWTGTHVAALPERTLSEEVIDYANFTDGFQSTIELLEALKENRSNPKLENVHGIMYYKDFFGSKILQKNDRGENLTGEQFDNEVVSPAFDLLNMSIYRCSDFQAIDDLDSRSYGSIYTTFNCNFKCSYCSISAPFGGNGYVKFSPKIVVDQIERLIKDYEIKRVRICDEMYMLDNKHIIGICDEIDKRGLGDLYSSWFYGRVDVSEKLDKKNSELLDRMLKSGHKYIALGIESASQSIRVDTDKKYTKEDIERTVRKIQSKGMYLIGNLMSGLGEDNLETMQDTLQMAMELQFEWLNIYSIMRYPGSQDYKDAVARGELLAENIPDIGWLGYSQHAYECYPASNSNLTNAQVLEFRDNAFKQYFANPNYQLMIKNKFGEKAYEYVKSIADRPKLKRKILGD